MFFGWLVISWTITIATATTIAIPKTIYLLNRILNLSKTVYAKLFSLAYLFPPSI